MNRPAPAPRGIACSVFKAEIESLKARGRVALDFDYLDSMLHMDSGGLRGSMDASVEAAAGGGVLLAYGECHPFMDAYAGDPGIRRTEGVNCVEILLGPERYARMRREGAFFFMPEWTLR
jgi:Protein of unknown function (DUF1638)